MDLVESERCEDCAGSPNGDAVRAAAQRRTAWWGTTGTLLVLAAVVAVSLYDTGGHLVYAIDDGGIHLSMARNLGLHGTWGVVPGHYQSASSSPLWTLLLAAFARILPRAVFEYAPVALSAAASIWLIWTLAGAQTIFGESRRRALQATAVTALAVVVLFLPGLVMTGMEHVLQCALVVQTIVLFAAAKRARRAPGLLAYVALFLAACTRFETLFVAAGLGMAEVVTWSSARRDGRGLDQWRALTGRLGTIAGVAAAPFVILGVVNLAFGQQFFPNSIIAKSALGGGANARSVSVAGGFGALRRDPIVLVLFAGALAYLFVAWVHGRLGRSAYAATVFATVVVLHSFLADYGWFERYQAYMIAAGVYFALGALSELFDARHASKLAVAILVLAAMLGVSKWQLLWDTPTATNDTYVQRYQAGLFLEHFYNGQAVATGELGYISYFHHGPITDFLGLGDHEVLVDREHKRQNARYWAELIKRRDVQVVVVYPLTLEPLASSAGSKRSGETPKAWVLVGLWRLDIRNVSGFEDTLQFWAPSKSRVLPILRQLEEWDARLPPGTHTELNPFLPAPSRFRTFPCC